MLKELTEAELDHVIDKIRNAPQLGYPPLEDRMRIQHVRMKGSRLFVPEGPWQVKPHANRVGAPAHLLDLEVPNDVAQLVDSARAQRWVAEGLLLDQHNRPIHPYWRQLLTDPRIGLPTGVGFFYRYGPNGTADPIIYRNTHGPLELLLIRRRDNGQWALPGGFEDLTDANTIETALRETTEEAGLSVPLIGVEQIHQSTPIGRRATIHAWTSNSAFLIHGNQEYLYDVTPVAGDDAIDVGWFTQEAMQRLEMFDDHPMYIELALGRIVV